MNAAEMWKKAQAAAKALEDVPGAEISIGRRVPTSTLEELARLAGCTLDRHGTVFRDGPHVLESIWARIGDVGLHAQGDRPATSADRNLSWSRYAVNGRLSASEVSVALDLPQVAP